jgi:hypothetical protein
MTDLYNYNGLTSDEQSFMNENAQDIIKAMEAGLETGRDYTDQINNGPGLKVESLDPIVKILENRESHLVFWKKLPKMRVYNTVHEYNQLYRYGDDVGIANLEGETPQFTDSQYRRKSVVLKFMGIGGQVTHPATLVKTADGVNMYSREIQNKTVKLLTQINQSLTEFDSSKVDVQFDGIFRQHLLGINEIVSPNAGKTSEQLLDGYFADPAIINANGAVLTDANVEDAANAVVNDRFGIVTEIMSNPIVFNDYVKSFHDSKRVLIGTGVTGTEAAQMGQSVNTIATQFGKISVANDIFFDRRSPISYIRPATSDKAPATPTIGVPPLAAVTDTKTQFGTDYAADYYYLVTAKNRYGESAPLAMNTSAFSVAATESVDLSFTATAGNYATESFVIYRTDPDVADRTVAKYYPMYEVSASELAAGYDGAAATLVRDRNRYIPNTHSAIVYASNNQIWEYLQLAPLMRMDFAITSPSRRFAVLNYGSPVLYQPGKISRIINIGRRNLTP